MNQVYGVLMCVWLSLCAAEIISSGSKIASPNKRAKVAVADTSVPAFSAGLTRDIQLAVNATVVYDKVFSNTGSGYDSSTGVFTCPRAGVYQFIFYGMAATGDYIYLDLYKNGNYEVTGYGHDVTDYATTSNRILLSLDVGDRVYIRGRRASHLYGRTTEIYNTFTGYIVLSRGNVDSTDLIG